MLRKFNVLLIFICFWRLAFGQTEIPYSRFGLGYLLQPEPAFMRGWANQSAAFHSSFNLNFVNPASYSYLNTTVFEAGLYSNRMKVTTASDSSGIFGDGGISTFALGFPIVKNKMGASLGLKPFSTVQYNIVQNNDSTFGLGESANYFQGSGGLYTFYIGSGFKWKDLSVGVNAEYIFGKLDYSTILAFPVELNAYNTLRDESRIVNDIIFTGGIQYHVNLNEEKTYALDFGITGNLKSNLNARHDLMYVRFTYLDNNGASTTTPFPHDTISSVTDGDGKIVLPARVSAGLIFSKANHYMFGVNYQFGNWSDYTSFGEKDFTSDSWKLSAGMQVVPDAKSYTQYLKLVAYRAGLALGKNYLTLDGKDLPEYEASVGFGFPMKRVLSEISVSGELSHLGTLKENPLKISTFRVSLGLTLNDRWFQKRKFD